MKIFIEQTGELGRIGPQGIIGAVWRGVTASGTPIEALILDIRVSGEDPVDIARLKIEMALLGEPEGRA